MHGEWAVPEYRHVRPLGDGVGGRVVLAVHEPSDTPVAIKYLAPAPLADPAFVSRLHAEALPLTELDDPGVVRLYEFVEAAVADPGGSAAGRPTSAALVYELVNGVSLAQVLNSNGPIGPQAALLLLRSLLPGLTKAHRRGLLHRDIRAANVLLNGDGYGKLSDFGIAVREHDQVPVAGSPAYLAPELWDGHEPSQASDIYAMTALFYECLTGEAPYPALALPHLAEAHRRAPVPVRGVPAPFLPLVTQGLAKNPARRPNDARSVLELLEALALAEFGAGWEERGRSELAERAAFLDLLFPLSRPIGAAGAGQARAGAAPADRVHAPSSRAGTARAAAAGRHGDGRSSENRSSENRSDENLSGGNGSRRSGPGGNGSGAVASEVVAGGASASPAGRGGAAPREEAPRGTRAAGAGRPGPDAEKPAGTPTRVFGTTGHEAGGRRGRNPAAAGDLVDERHDEGRPAERPNGSGRPGDGRGRPGDPGRPGGTGRPGGAGRPGRSGRSGRSDRPDKDDRGGRRHRGGILLTVAGVAVLLLGGTGAVVYTAGNDEPLPDRVQAAPFSPDDEPTGTPDDRDSVSPVDKKSGTPSATASASPSASPTTGTPRASRRSGARKPGGRVSLPSKPGGGPTGNGTAVTGLSVSWTRTGPTATGSVTVTTTGPGTVTLSISYFENGQAAGSDSATLSGRTSYSTPISYDPKNNCVPLSVTVSTSPGSSNGAQSAQIPKNPDFWCL